VDWRDWERLVAYSMVILGRHLHAGESEYSWTISELRVKHRIADQPSPVKSSSKKVAVNLLILQGGAVPLSSAPVWAEPSQLLLGNWLFGRFPHDDKTVSQDLSVNLKKRRRHTIRAICIRVLESPQD
jgi:hypothetical protein